eukprot:403334901
MNTQNNQVAALKSPTNQLHHFSSNVVKTQQSQMPLISQIQSPNQQSNIVSPNMTQRTSMHHKSNSLGAQSNQSLHLSSQKNQQQTKIETQRQKYIMQQSQLYANSGNKLKAAHASTPGQQKPAGSTASINNQFDNIGWVFFKNESFSGPISQGGPNLMAQSVSYKKRLQKLKEMNRSQVQSDNTSLDSPANNDKFMNSTVNNFAEIIQKHHEKLKNEQNIEQDLTQLVEYQQQYNLHDDDSPSQILEKVAQQVHDQMCCGVNLPAKSISNSFNKIPIKFQKSQISQKNSNNQLNNGSFDSKSNSLLLQDSSLNQQTNTTLNFERIPKINGFNAKIKTVANSNQNSARMSQVIAQIGNTNNLTTHQIAGIQNSGGSGSNFQSFKKNAMKLPKVTMRTSLLNQISNQKTTSLPISPRVFESAKFGSSSNNKQQSMNNSQKNDSTNNDNSFTQVNPFALPQIDRSSVQGSGVIYNENSLSNNVVFNGLINQSTYANSNFENQFTHASIHSNNRSSLLKDFKTIPKNINTETDIGESQIDLNNFHIQSSIQALSNQQESSFMITEAKVEGNIKARFTLNSLRNRVLQSPMQNQSKYQQATQQTLFGQNNQQSIAQKIKRHSLNNSGLQLNPINTTTSVKQSIKMCSSCHRKQDTEKQFSFDLQNIETVQNQESSLNKSCLSDGQIQDFSSQKIQNFGIKRPQFSNNSLNKIVIESVDDSQIRTKTITKEICNEYSKCPQYNCIRDNKFFNQFTSQYNNQLMQNFEEADKQCMPKKNKRDLENPNQSPLITMKQDLMAYMEQHSEIRQKIKQEQELVSMKSQIRKILVKKQNLHSFYENNSNQVTGTGTNISTGVDMTESLIYQEGVEQNSMAKQSISKSNNSSIKQDIMKNYGRYYLKPQEFNRLINNMKSQKTKHQNSNNQTQNALNNTHLEIAEDEEDASATFIDEFNITMNSQTNSSSNYHKRNASLQ